MGEMGKALNRFLDKIEALETTVSDLEAERDRLQANQEQLAQLQDLQTENQQLRSHLEQVQAELADPRKMLERVLAQQSVSSAPTEPIAPTAAPAAPAPIATAAPRRSAPPHAPAESSHTRGDKAEIIDQIIEAMISYNTSQEHIDQMLRISFPAIKGIASAMGPATKPRFRRVSKHGKRIWRRCTIDSNSASAITRVCVERMSSSRRSCVRIWAWRTGKK